MIFKANLVIFNGEFHEQFGDERVRHFDRIQVIDGTGVVGVVREGGGAYHGDGKNNGN